MSDALRPVADLAAVRSARADEATRRGDLRPFLVHVVLTSFAVLPPNPDPDADPGVEVFDAADLVPDPGRLGEIARAMVAAMDRSEGNG